MFDIRETDHVLRGQNNVYSTKALFLECGNDEAVYTLKPQDYDKNGKTYISMYRVYMECIDEYNAAERLLGSQRHWRKLSELDWFLNGHEAWGHEGLKNWRTDMKNRDESEAKAALLQAVKEGNVNAAKAILGSAPKSKPKLKKAKPDTEDEDLFKGFDKASENHPIN